MLCMYISKISGDVSGILCQIIVPFHQLTPICLKLGKQRVLTKSLYSYNFQKIPLSIPQIMTSQILTFYHFSKKITVYLDPHISNSYSFLSLNANSPIFAL